MSDLEIEPDEGLAESIHLVFFSDNIVGMEYNHFGPRITQLPSYLMEKANGQEVELRLLPILRGNVKDLINELTDLRVMELTLAPSFAETVANVDESLAEALKSAQRLSGDEGNVALTLRFERSAQPGVIQRLRGGLQHFLNSQEFSSGAERFRLHGKRADTDRVETIDFLSDQLISKKTILCANPRTRGLDSTEAVRAVREAHSDLRDELRASASVFIS